MVGAKYSLNLWERYISIKTETIYVAEYEPSTALKSRGQDSNPPANLNIEIYALQVWLFTFYRLDYITTGRR